VFSILGGKSVKTVKNATAYSFILILKGERIKAHWAESMFHARRRARVGRRSPSRQARINAMKVKKMLSSSAGLESRSFWTQGIVVTANSEAEITERKPPDYVKTTRIDHLPDYIKNEARRFEAKDIEQIEAEIKRKIEMP
jgi:hypothetical protein